jgi:exosortase
MYLVAWILFSLLLFFRPLRELVQLALADEDLSYVLVIPFLAGGVLYLNRHRNPVTRSYDKASASLFLVLAAFAALLTRFSRLASIDHLRVSGYVLSWVLFGIAGFALLYGRTGLKAARFGLLFLVLTIPPPEFLLGRVIHILQSGSAWMTAAFFELLGIPFLREGFVFHLARVDIEVAKECSGIRSSMAMLILALLISHFQLKSLPAKLMFVACGTLMMVVKNGIRIATLTVLAMYVDPSFLFGRLHHQGGVVFFLIGLVLLLPVLALLKRGESWLEARQTGQRSSEAAA